MRTLVLLAAMAVGSTICGAQQQGVARVAPKVVRLQLRLDGLQPKEITVEEGTYEVLLENKAFLGQVEFQLDREGGQQLARTNAAAKGKFRGRQRLELELRAGKHELQVVGQPNWKSIVTVTPKR